MITQRVIVPGGKDLVTSPPISRTAFEKMKGGQSIPILGGTNEQAYVLRAECVWDARQDTIALLPEIARVLDLLSES